MNKDQYRQRFDQESKRKREARQARKDADLQRMMDKIDEPARARNKELAPLNEIRNNFNRVTQDLLNSYPGEPGDDRLVERFRKVAEDFADAGKPNAVRPSIENMPFPPRRKEQLLNVLDELGQ